MEDVVQALMIAFSALVFVVAFTVSMYMFSQVTSTAETLVYYTDSTAYYDNVKISDNVLDEDIKKGNYRIVSAETIIPTLYRYADERFCVKIYNDTNELIQIFDLDLESKLPNAIADTKAILQTTPEQKEKYAYKTIYNDPSKPYYMHGAPWGGSTENARKRVSLFINGEAGYINNKYVNYKDSKYNQFSEALKMSGKQFKERFISYSWDGATMTTDEGDVLVTENKPQDKIVIIYTMM